MSDLSPVAKASAVHFRVEGQYRLRLSIKYMVLKYKFSAREAGSYGA